MTDAEPNRRPRVPQSALLATVSVAGLVVVALVLLRDHGSKGANTPGATVSGLPPTRGDLVLQPVSDADVRGVVLVADDSAALDVVVDHGTEPSDCSLLEPQITVVSQSRSAVLLRASGYEYLPKAATQGGGYVGFNCVQAGVQVIRVHLDDPIGARSIGYQLGGNRRQPVVPADPHDNPAPAYVPNGYTLTALEPVDATKGTLVTTRRYTRGSDTLELRVGDPRELLQGEPVVGHATVLGRPATISDQDDGRCVTWHEPSGRARQLCSNLGSGGSLPTAELLKIARSVR